MAAALSWEQEIWEDLKPTPGRLNSSLRILASTIIALVLMLVLQLPFISLGLYFIFLIGRDTPSISLRTSVIFLVTITLAIVAEFAVVGLTDNSPMARVVSVALVSFIAGLFMLAAPALSSIASAWGFIFCVLIGLWENHAPADNLVKTSLYLFATASLALAASVVVELLFALRSPAELLFEQRRIRYQALTAMFDAFAKGAEPADLAPAISLVSRLAGAGQNAMHRLYSRIVDRNLDTGSLPVGARVHITMLAQIMDLSAAFGSQHMAGADPELRERCRKIADQCRDLISSFRSNSISNQPANMEQLTILDRVEFDLKLIQSMPEHREKSGKDDAQSLVALPSKEVGIIKPGALRSPEAVAFALKISLCTTLCYIFYLAVDWPGISTAVTTVLITGLSSTGAIKQKMVFRFMGSAIGGLIFGLGSTALLFPHMDSITSLAALVGVVAFGSAWWSAGRRFSYVGLQIAFSFYLVAFEGFRAPTELAPARDRLVGIIVALVVMWFVFDQIWPVRTVTLMRRAFASVLQNEAKLFRLDERDGALLPRADVLRDEVGKTLAALRSMNDAVGYEFGTDRERNVHASEVMVRGALTAVAMFWNQLAVLHSEADDDFVHDPDLIELRNTLAATLDVMAKAVVEDKAYLPAALDNFARIPLRARFREYAQNAVERFQELQAIVSSLTVRAPAHPLAGSNT
jgi:multidrug resistance protein MdtO